MAYPPRPIAVRIQRNVVVAPNGCWLWQKRLSRGYGRLDQVIDGRPKGGLAHRVSYELFVGPIPEGMQLDHLCHTRDRACPGGPSCLHRRCVNPEHLEPVTSAENTRRSPVNRALRTHCPQGHQYTEANTYADSKGWRRCATCVRASNTARYAKNSAKYPAAQRLRRTMRSVA